MISHFNVSIKISITPIAIVQEKVFKIMLNYMDMNYVLKNF